MTGHCFCLFPIFLRSKANTISGSLKKADVLFPAHSTFAMLQTNKLLFHSPAAYRSPLITASLFLFRHILLFLLRRLFFRYPIFRNTKPVSYTHLDVYKRQVCNQCCIIEFFCFDPKVLTGLLPLSFCVDYDCVDEFQNVLFAPQISKWIIMHGFCKVYGVEDFNLILAPLQHLPTFH